MVEIVPGGHVVGMSLRKPVEGFVELHRLQAVGGAVPVHQPQDIALPVRARLLRRFRQGYDPVMVQRATAAIGVTDTGFGQGRVQQDLPAVAAPDQVLDDGAPVGKADRDLLRRLPVGVARIGQPGLQRFSGRAPGAEILLFDHVPGLVAGHDRQACFHAQRLQVVLDAERVNARQGVRRLVGRECRMARQYREPLQ